MLLTVEEYQFDIESNVGILVAGAEWILIQWLLTPVYFLGLFQLSTLHRRSVVAPSVVSRITENIIQLAIQLQTLINM